MNQYTYYPWLAAASRLLLLLCCCCLGVGTPSAMAAVAAISNIDTFGGSVSIDGVAPPGARVEVWLDDGSSEPHSEVVIADANGVWRIEPGGVDTDQLQSCTVTVSAFLLADDGTATGVVEDVQFQHLALAATDTGGGAFAIVFFDAPVSVFALLLCHLRRQRLRVRRNQLRHEGAV